MPDLSISDKLAIELVSVAKDYLCDDNYSRDQLELQILLTLSKAFYVNQLLFRDLSKNSGEVVHQIGSERVHDQAITYLYQVLGRRLRLARNLIDKPSNMHRLLLTVCQFGARSHNWSNAVVERRLHQQVSSNVDGYLRPVQKALSDQISLLANNYSPESYRRREQFGPLWLISGQNVIEMPEEMSLFDVFEAIPKNLNPSFVNASPVRNTMIRVIKSLNERYMLLRSCGLNLNEWLENPDVSIQKLRDMKHLRKDAEGLLRAGQAKSVVSAYRQAFEQHKLSKNKLAGVENFDYFARTEYGAQLMQLYFTPMQAGVRKTDYNEHSGSNGILEPLQDNIFEDSMIRQLDSRRKVKAILSAENDIDDVMKFIFEEVVIGNRPLLDHSDSSAVVNDIEFISLVNESPIYNRLNRTELVQTLYSNAEQIIRNKLIDAG